MFHNICYNIQLIKLNIKTIIFLMFHLVLNVSKDFQVNLDAHKRLDESRAIIQPEP